MEGSCLRGCLALRWLWCACPRGRAIMLLVSTRLLACVCVDIYFVSMCAERRWFCIMKHTESALLEPGWRSVEDWLLGVGGVVLTPALRVVVVRTVGTVRTVRTKPRRVSEEFSPFKLLTSSHHAPLIRSPERPPTVSESSFFLRPGLSAALSPTHQPLVRLFRVSRSTFWQCSAWCYG